MAQQKELMSHSALPQDPPETKTAQCGRLRLNNSCRLIGWWGSHWTWIQILPRGPFASCSVPLRVFLLQCDWFCGPRSSFQLHLHMTTATTCILDAHICDIDAIFRSWDIEPWYPHAYGVRVKLVPPSSAVFLPRGEMAECLWMPSVPKPNQTVHWLLQLQGSSWSAELQMKRLYVSKPCSRFG